MERIQNGKDIDSDWLYNLSFYLNPRGWTKIISKLYSLCYLFSQVHLHQISFPIFGISWVNYIVTRTSLTIQTATLPWQVPFPIMKSRRRKKLEKQFASFTGPTFDADLYSDNDKASCYPSIPATEEEEEEEDNLHKASRRNNSSFFVPIVNPNDDVFSTSRRIIDRDGDWLPETEIESDSFAR